MHFSSRPVPRYSIPQIPADDDAGDLGSGDANRHGPDYPEHGGPDFGYPEHGRPPDDGPGDGHYSYSPAADDDKAARAVLLMARHNNYKPVPLRWPYIATLMSLLLAAIGIIIAAHAAMPHSDTTADLSEHAVRRRGIEAEAEADQPEPSIVYTAYTVTPTAEVTLVSTMTAPAGSTTLFSTTTHYALSTVTGGTLVTENGSVFSTPCTATVTVTSVETAPASSQPAATLLITYVSTSTGHPYVTYGRYTLSPKTPAPTPTPTPTPTLSPTVVAAETTATVLVTSVVAGSTVTTVSTPAPVTRVTTVPGGMRTRVVSLLHSSQAVVSTVPGATVTVDMSEVTVDVGRDGTTVRTVSRTALYQDGRPTVVTVAPSAVTRTPASPSLATTTVVYSAPPHASTAVSSAAPSTLVTTRAAATRVSTAVATRSVAVSSMALVTPAPAAAPPDNDDDDDDASRKAAVVDLQPGTYFVATFLPTIAAVLLSLPLRAIDASAKMYQPFQALARPGGARGADSLTLEFSGLVGGLRTSAAAAWRQREYVPLVTSVLVLLSSLLAPLATGALGLKLHGACSIGDETGCAAGMGVAVAPAFVLVGVLALMVVLLGVLLALLGAGGRWRTGVRAAPWNLAGLASLTACPGLVEGASAGASAGDRVRRRQQRSRATASARSLQRALADRHFALGLYETEPGRYAYGIIPVGDHPEDENETDSINDGDGDGDSFLSGDVAARKKPRQLFLTLTVGYRVVFIVFLAALLAADLAYHIAAAGGGSVHGNPTKGGFGFFVATHGFGVTFVMAAVGVLVSFGWAALLASVATIAPFQAMSLSSSSARPQPAERSILLPSRPTNEFSSLAVAVRLLGFNRGRGFFGLPRRARDAPPARYALFLALVAVMTLLSEFLPVLLVNVPFRPTQTRDASVACARTVAVVLALMLLTLVASFVAVPWPVLPADPRTLAGSMYYTVESHALPAAVRALEAAAGRSLSLMTTAEKRRGVRALGRRYYYGAVVGPTGRPRMAVDADTALLDPVLEAAAASDDGHSDAEDEGGHARPALASIQTAYEDAPYYVRDQAGVYAQQAGQTGQTQAGQTGQTQTQAGQRRVRWTVDERRG